MKKIKDPSLRVFIATIATLLSLFLIVLYYENRPRLINAAYFRYNETCYFQCNVNGVVSVTHGDRASSGGWSIIEDIQWESYYKSGRYTLSTEDLAKLNELIQRLSQYEGFGKEHPMIADGWDSIVWYNGKAYEINYGWEDWVVKDGRFVEVTGDELKEREAAFIVRDIIDLLLDNSPVVPWYTEEDIKKLEQEASR